MKSRRRIRRPKFLSLRHQLTPAAVHHEQPMNLFPLQPGTSTADQEGNVARLFTAADGGGATLAGLLPAAEEGSEEATASPSSVSAYSDCRESSMVRAALRRSHEREEEEEEIRWVRMSEVVGGGRKTEEEVSSRAAASAEGEETSSGQRGLSLKLDYKEVLEAWCDKERPFLGEAEGEGPQTVPDLQLEHDFSYDQLNGGSEQLWRVPNANGDVAGRQREASVLRYREKRMNRLFSKRIRYQVRKLNAENRPRVKGRFVKRS